MGVKEIPSFCLLLLARAILCTARCLREKVVMLMMMSLQLSPGHDGGAGLGWVLEDLLLLALTA